MGYAAVTPLAGRRRRERHDGQPREEHGSRPPRASLRAPITVVVVCDDPGLRGHVAGQVTDDDIALLAAVDCADACAGLTPDAVVVPHRPPGTSAIDACERLHRDDGPVLVVLATSMTRASLLRRVVQAGAKAFVAADSPPALLRDAIRSAVSGRPFFDPVIGHLVVELVARTPTRPHPYGLTPAQLDVVALLPKGLRNREIAAELGITENTVKTHLRHALRKLGVPNRAQAAALVKREGLA